MPIPTHEDAMLPVLKVLSDGKSRYRRTIAENIADYFGLTADERSQMLPSGSAPVIRSRTGWALSYMKQAGLVESPQRGLYQITDAGKQVVNSGVVSIDNGFLEQFEGFREFQARSRNAGRRHTGEDATSTAAEQSEPTAPPDEELERAYDRLRAAVEAELGEMTRRVPPGFFEELVIDLLVRMGYGGSHAEAARAIGRSGDGGIDGVIDEDRLGLDSIYVQAKRWDSSVGRPEIQKFAGALQGQRATKGVFITTSTFTRDAEEYAQQISTRIVLIDGRRLAALMFEHDVGVSSKRTYVVKDIDGDYFEE